MVALPEFGHSLAVRRQALLEIGVDVLDAAEALEEFIGVRSALIDVSGLDEGTHHFEDLALFLG